MAAPKKPALAHRMRPPDVGRAAAGAHRRARLEDVDLGVALAETDRAVKTQSPDEIIGRDTRL